MLLLDDSGYQAVYLEGSGSACQDGVEEDDDCQAGVEEDDYQAGVEEGDQAGFDEDDDCQAGCELEDYHAGVEEGSQPPEDEDASGSQPPPEPYSSAEDRPFSDSAAHNAFRRSAKLNFDKSTSPSLPPAL